MGKVRLVCSKMCFSAPPNRPTGSSARFPALERAAQVCPIDAGILVQLALALAERQELTAAGDRLAQAKRLDPGDRRIDQAIAELAGRQRSGRRRRKAA